MARTEIYFTNWCPYCHQAKALLDRKGVDYEGIDLTHATPEKIDEMRTRSGRTSVPQIFIDGQHVGGFDDVLLAHGKDVDPEGVLAIELGEAR